MALSTAIRISAEERAWAYHLSMDRAEADYWNGIRSAKEDGISIGEKRGEKRGREETARNLLDMGVLSREQIAGATGLSLAEVEKLAVS